MPDTMHFSRILFVALTAVVTGFPFPLLSHPVIAGEHANKPRTQRLLLIGQGPDGSHARTTHEYFAGVNLLAKLLHKQPNLETIVVSADGLWNDGPQLLERADCVVLFVAEGAKWLSADSVRLSAFREFATRGGGLVALHWATGTKTAEPTDAFAKLFGACHGGPDRRHKIVHVTPELVADNHPILRCVRPEAVQEEFYFALKMAPRNTASPVTLLESESDITPLLKIAIDDTKSTVCWSWQRPTGGRSFGFTGLHFHENWKHESYRRLITQATLWTLDREIPVDGVSVEIDPKSLSLPPDNK